MLTIHQRIDIIKERYLPEMFHHQVNHILRNKFYYDFDSLCQVIMKSCTLFCIDKKWWKEEILIKIWPSYVVRKYYKERKKLFILENQTKQSLKNAYKSVGEKYTKNYFEYRTLFSKRMELHYFENDVLRQLIGYNRKYKVEEIHQIDSSVKDGGYDKFDLMSIDEFNTKVYDKSFTDDNGFGTLAFCDKKFIYETDIDIFPSDVMYGLVSEQI